MQERIASTVNVFSRRSYKSQKEPYIYSRTTEYIHPHTLKLNSKSNISLLNINPTPVPVLRSPRLPIIQPQLPNVPVLRVCLRARADRLNNLLQVLPAGRGIQRDRARVKVDPVRKVVPHAGLERRRPLRGTAGVPGELRVGVSVFQFGEVALFVVSIIQPRRKKEKKRKKVEMTYLEKRHLVLQPFHGEILLLDTN